MMNNDGCPICLNTAFHQGSSWLNHPTRKMVEKVESCPECRSGEVRRATQFARHILRKALGSRKRCCLSCGNKWHRTDLMAPPASPSYRMVWIVFLCLCTGGFAAFISSVPWDDPIGFFKTTVRGYYHETYGKDAKKTLWSHLGIFYQNKEEAESDHSYHAPDKP